MAGNANSGRREKHFLTALLMELKAAGKDMPELRIIARQMIDKAKEGDGLFMRELIDRLDGKAPQAIDHSGFISTRSDKMTDEELENIAASQQVRNDDERTIN